jgi:hypothetical protein
MGRIAGATLWEVWIPRAIGAGAVLLGLLLGGMIWLVHDSVVRASEALIQGQATEIIRAAANGFLRGGAPLVCHAPRM